LRKITNLTSETQGYISGYQYRFYLQMIQFCWSLTKMKVLWNINLKMVYGDSDVWFHRNNLIINVEKTIALSFHTTQNRLLVRPQIIFKNMAITFK